MSIVIAYAKQRRQLQPIGKPPASDLAQKVQQICGNPELHYQSRQASYDSKKFRAKVLVRKIDHSLRYEDTDNGLRAMAAFMILREKIISVFQNVLKDRDEQ
jgi:hypothetical protein